jgi:Rrf2 family protein
MTLSHATVYALQALVALAHGSQRPLASHLIARGHGLPERFLLKVLRPLVAAGVLDSLKGPNGGFRLARPASRITLLEAVEPIEGPWRGVTPPVGNQEGGALNRRLAVVCQRVTAQERKVLGGVSVADLAKGPVRGK